MRWGRPHVVCIQGGFVLVLLPFATGQGKGKKSLKKCLGAAEQGKDGVLSPLLSGTENLQLPLNFDFIHSHFFQDGKPNTALITEKVGFHLGLFRRDSAVMFWSWIQSSSEEQSPSRDGGASCKAKRLFFQKYSIVVLVLEFAGEGTDFCCLILGLGSSLTIKDKDELLSYRSLPLKFHQDFGWILSSGLGWLRLFPNKCKG